tara:strand:+ start:61 stop:648 length:588 start_codon:yes stop_codon:yes gene_type:complete
VISISEFKEYYKTKRRKGGYMRFFILTICLTFFANISYAEEQTELEKFSAKTGIVKIMGYTRAGKVLAGDRSYSNYISFQARILGTPNKPETTKGILISVTDKDGYSGNSFIDEDEIDDLLSGIEYISKATKDITSLDQFEIDYTTLGNFEITVFNKNDGSLGLFVQSGSRSVRPSFDSLPLIVEKIKEAKALLN